MTPRKKASIATSILPKKVPIHSIILIDTAKWRVIKIGDSVSNPIPANDRTIEEADSMKRITEIVIARNGWFQLISNGELLQEINPACVENITYFFLVKPTLDNPVEAVKQAKED